MLPGDKIISALPDWGGRLWFASTNGVVGTIDPASGAVRSRPLGEKIANSFAVEDTGAVYIVTDAALYRLEAGAGRRPAPVWRVPYENSGVQKPGQASAGSGTTPTLMGDGLVAITDNADPMNVLVYRRGSGQRICRQPVFERGASATDQSLIGTGRSLVVENNYGYAGPTATQGGKTTSPGLERVDLDAGGGCHSAWRSAERAPSVVPKLSARNGIVYTYTKDPQPQDPSADAWYLTALDFGTGRTLYKRLGGEGLGHNNNYAPVTLGPDGTAYVGTLGGLVALRDKTPPPGAQAATGPTGGRKGLRRLRLHVRRLGRKRVRVRVHGRRHAAGAAGRLRAREEAARAGSAAAVPARRAGRAAAGAAEGADRAAGRAAGGADEAGPRRAAPLNCALRGWMGGGVADRVSAPRPLRRASGQKLGSEPTNCNRGPLPVAQVAETPLNPPLNAPLPFTRAQEPPDRRMRLARRLELRHVPAVELDVLRARQRLAHVAREGDRHEPVLLAPHEQRLVLRARAAASRTPRRPRARRGRCCAAPRRTRRGRAAACTRAGTRRRRPPTSRCGRRARSGGRPARSPAAA